MSIESNKPLSELFVLSFLHHFVFKFVTAITVRIMYGRDGVLKSCPGGSHTGVRGTKDPHFLLDKMNVIHKFCPQTGVVHMCISRHHNALKAIQPSIVKNE